MCKAWPGFRCSTHPSERVRSSAQELHDSQNEIALLEAEQREAYEKMGRNYEGSELEAEHMEELDKLHDKHEKVAERYKQAQTEFSMTAEGKKALEEAILDDANSPYQKYLSAADLAAAQHRTMKQREIARVLQNPETPNSVKHLKAVMEVHRTRAEIADRNEALEVVQGRVKHINELLDQATAAGDREKMKAYKAKLAAAKTEEKHLSAYINQLTQHLIQTNGWLERYTDRSIETAINMYEKSAKQALNLLF